MHPRRSHTKSRRGCLPCKHRRVRCDEKHPDCNSCLKRGVQCEYGNLFLFSSKCNKQQVPPLQDRQQNGPISSDEGEAGALALPLSRTELLQSTESALTSSLNPRLNLDLNMQTLELMHHYCAETCLGLFEQGHLRNLWQHVVPEHAMSHSFLMHGLLAVSALHIALKDPRGRPLYTTVARNHQIKALQLYRPSLNQATPANCHALFAFSALTVISSFAYLQFSSPGPEEIIDTALQIVTFARGLREVYRVCREWMNGGDLAATLRVEEVKTVPVSDDFNGAIRGLMVHNEKSTDSETVKSAYASAIYELHHTFGTRGPECRINLTMWPIVVPDIYADLLKGRCPFALVLLAYYGVLLHIGLRSWWSKGFGRRLVEAIYQKLHDEWRVLIAWPMQCVKTFVA